MEPREPSYAATVVHRLTTLLLILSVVFGAIIVIQAVRGPEGDVVVEATAPLDGDLLPKGVYATSDQRTDIAITTRRAASAGCRPRSSWRAWRCGSACSGCCAASPAR